MSQTHSNAHFVSVEIVAEGVAVALVENCHLTPIGKLSIDDRILAGLYLRHRLTDDPLARVVSRRIAKRRRVEIHQRRGTGWGLVRDASAEQVPDPRLLNQINESAREASEGADVAGAPRTVEVTSHFLLSPKRRPRPMFRCKMP